MILPARPSASLCHLIGTLDPVHMLSRYFAARTPWPRAYHLKTRGGDSRCTAQTHRALNSRLSISHGVVMGIQYNSLKFTFLEVDPFRGNIRLLAK